MSKVFDISGSAKHFAGRHPLINFIFIQITFWITAEVLLALLFHFMLSAFSQIFTMNDQKALFMNRIFFGVLLGIIYGITFGIMDYFFERHYFRRLSLGISLLIKTITSFIVFLTLYILIKFMFENYLRPMYYVNAPVFNQEFWKYLFYMFILYNYVMILIINFINQVNKKYGPGVLLPLLLGKYRKPRVEEKIFMFMDLKSSTTIAEKLGHLKYSSFISDSLMDINLIMPKYNAEIYQYVGDEIVITWSLKSGLSNRTCLKFFFACEEEFKKRSEYYLEKYGIIPEFKAGLHMGKITTVEIGEIKRDLAYHGDTINTTARIQSVCNDYKKHLLISKFMFDNFDDPVKNKNYRSESLGMIQLKGKLNPIEIISIEL
ncbi:MAG: adenylate/guanylate cyclase domain-containing protein [Ignavibacteriae bacterium]|nr:adenylate/guanylate cyclase domain-containing protein [Ignavibacteriota bacterium]